MTQTQSDLAAQVRAVNDLLEAGEPSNISTDEHSGYTGYKPQFIIDAMNDVFGIGMWGFEEVSSEIVPTGDKGGLLAVAQVKVWLKDVQGAPVGWGQNRVTRGDIGDARKGAQTDAIKKALSYFSIGNRAYQGLLGEDSHAQPTRRVEPKPARPQTTLRNGHGSPVVVKQQHTPKTLFEQGKRNGLWSEKSISKFYAKASEISGRLQSQTHWDMTPSEMAEMAQQIYEQMPAAVAGAN